MPAAAQVNRNRDAQRSPSDTLHLKADSLSVHDTTANTGDTSARNQLESSLGIRISRDALPSAVNATATDSAVLDMEQNLFYLYGDTHVGYEDLKLDAGRVIYEQKTNIITASPAYDSAGNAGTRPSFSQGQEKFTFDSLQYNFKTKRALVRNARSQYGEGFVFSQQVKRNPDQSIFGYRSVYTTCSLDTPHFGIRARRIKVIPDHIIVSGAANLEIEGVPTPIYLPFGVFPITQSQRSGFRLPSYTLEEQRGLGLTNGGYYFYISDYIDLLVLTNIYSKGSYGVSAVSTYANRYHYNGGFSFNYAYNKTGEVYEPNSSIQKEFALQWRHQTDPKSHPGVSFNTSVNIQKGNYYSDNSYNTTQIIQNQYQSNITYSKSWQGKPYSLTVSALHDQNTLTHLVNVTLPQVNFYVSQISPFQNKNRIGPARWYEKITASYNFSALARTSFYDTSFNLRTLGLNDFNSGFHHSIPVSASYTALRYINVAFGASYNEYWLTEQLYRAYNTTENKIDTTIHRGFYATRDFSTTMQLSTRIYGLKRFAKGKIAGIRHVLTPQAGFTYTPDFAAAPFKYYYQTYLDPSGNIEYLSPYERSVVGSPGLGQHGNFSSTINFGLNNNLQLKTRSGKDSMATTKNITLIDGLGINSGYNIAADSFNWGMINMNFRTDILDKVNVSAAANFDPYVYDHVLGRRINQTAWSAGQGIARFTDATVALGAGFHSGKTAEPAGGDNAKKSDEYDRLTKNNGTNDYVDFNIPWSLNISYALRVTNNFRTFINGGDTLTLDQHVQFSGDFNLTPRWKIGYSSGYNVNQKQLTLTSLDIYRDLHCWEMRLHMIPFGANKSYTFTLNVKASILQDLRLLRRRDYRDAVAY